MTISFNSGRFTRKALRAHCHWGDTQLKVHLARLVELEYVLMHRRGLQCDYELVYDASEDAQHSSAHMNGLIDAASLGGALGSTSEPIHAYDTTRSASNAIQSGSGRPLGGGLSGGGRGSSNPPPTRMDIDVSPQSRINGSKAHSSALSSLAADHVVAASVAVSVAA